MPWVDIVNGIKKYKFNIFITDLAKATISRRSLISIINAQLKNGRDNLSKDLGISYSIRLYTEKDMTDPKLFRGDRIPIYIVSGLMNNFLVNTFAQIDSITNAGILFPTQNSNANIQSILGLSFPVPNCFPDWTPYGSLDLLNLKNKISIYKTNKNIYALQDFKQLISFGLSWILGNTPLYNVNLTNIAIDFYAPVIDSWKYAEFDSSGNCTNSILDPAGSGYYFLPSFKETFPDGGYINISAGLNNFNFSVSKIISFHVDKWSISNYVLDPYYNDVYYKSTNLKYDNMKLFKQPLDSYCNNLSLNFTNQTSGVTTMYTGNAINNGPVTYSQLGKPITCNFPPNYTYVTLSPIFPTP